MRSEPPAVAGGLLLIIKNQLVTSTALSQVVLTNLLHRALRRFLIRPPTQKLRPVTEAAAGEVIVLDFDDQLGSQRVPLG